MIPPTAEFRNRVTSLGIIRDAEYDAAGARRSVEHAVAVAKIRPAVRVSIFVLPDNSSRGMIETLCLDAIRQHFAVANELACVEQFFACLEHGGVALPDAVRRAKNLAQAFLATKLEPQMFPGIAAYRGHWPFDSSVFEPLKQFLRSL